MILRVVRPDDDLESLRGAVVVLDIFRAGNTVLALLEAGAGEVLLVPTLERARALKAVDPTLRLLGERGGLPPDDFDGGNSPPGVAAVVAPGEGVILTTSAGTRALHRLGGAEAVFLGTFVGAAALSAAVQRLAGDEVAFLPMGLEAREPALEDELAAEFLAARLTGGSPPFEPVRERLWTCPGAHRLRRIGGHEDLEWCLRLDASLVVPRVEPGDPSRAFEG